MKKHEKTKSNKTPHVNKYRKCANNPDVDISPTIADIKKKKYSLNLDNNLVKDPHENPRLEWYNKYETDEFEMDILPLHIHEKISPSIILKPILNTPQTTLFSPTIIPSLKTMKFYQHEDNWSNRLILGNSLQTLTSLIEREPSVSGHVQMIYFDPPYGINYSSNFQSGYKSAPDKKIEYRPEAIKAFRDTWDYGTHSYLSNIRKQLIAAYEILADTGSIFLQISQVNVHRVRLLLDEIFGAENFMWDILFQTKTGAGVGKFPSTCDYILWYAKDKEIIKKSNNLHQLYLDRDDKSMEIYNKIHLKDGTFIPVPKSGKIPKGGKLCCTTILFSQHSSPSERSNSHRFPNGKIITPTSTKQWSLSFDALDNLFEKNRLYFTENKVRLISYPEDYPQKLGNIWKGMTIVGEKIYDVQTKTTVVERCMLMSTNPGDLVMDLTCGSGVTPYCAEKYGRRWIACDVSKLALSIATTRLQTSVYDWYKLKSNTEGIRGGLQYEEFIKLTAGTLSAPDTQKTEYRYEKPIKEKNRLRISGPFNIEAIPSAIIISTKDQIDDSTRKIWADSLRMSGVITNNGRLKFKTLEENKKTSTIHYIGTTEKNQTFAISFGPKHSALTEPQVTRAMKERKSIGIDGLLFIGSIVSTKAKDVIYTAPEEDRVFYAEANNDMLIPDLQSKETDRAFVQIGRPRVDIIQKDDKYIVQIKGYDYFDVEQSRLTHEGTDKIAMWLLDIDYDGITMRPQQIFFPNTDDMEKFAKKLKHTLRNDELNIELLKKFTGTESIPFKLGKQKTISVKIIDMDGRESKYTKNIGDYND